MTSDKHPLTINAFLKPSWCINSDAQEILHLAKELTDHHSSDVNKALSLYYYVRDEILYNPYTADVSQEAMSATNTLAAGEAWCVPKAVLMAALCRASNIPARLGFADVVNHLSTERLRAKMQTNVFYFHGYCSVYLNNNWVKCTPAFNLTLCEKFKLRPLEFDGINDSLYHEFDQAGNRHMEYVNERGEYLDVPIEEMLEVFDRYYSNSDVSLDSEKEINLELQASDWNTDVTEETKNN